jgi:hypothetical protein
LAKGGFEAVRKAVKGVGREGWSAGQILEQVRLKAKQSKVLTNNLATRRSDTYGYDTGYA